MLRNIEIVAGHGNILNIGVSMLTYIFTYRLYFEAKMAIIDTLRAGKRLAQITGVSS